MLHPMNEAGNSRRIYLRISKGAMILEDTSSGEEYDIAVSRDPSRYVFEKAIGVQMPYTSTHLRNTLA